MQKCILKDFVLILVLIFITCMCYFPLLPYGMTMTVYSVLVIIFGILAIMSWHEKARDEREEKHRSVSSQLAFFCGGFILIAGIVYGGLVDGHVDTWLIAAFIAMLLGRVLGRLWAQHYY